MDTITLKFNVDIERLRALGIDPSTSEGRARLQDLVLDAFGEALDAREGYAPLEEDEVMRLFRAEYV